MEENDLYSKVKMCLITWQHDGIKQASTIDVYKMLVENDSDVSFSAIDGIMTEIAKVYTLPISRIYTEFYTNGFKHDEYGLVFLNKNRIE